MPLIIKKAEYPNKELEFLNKNLAWLYALFKGEIYPITEVQNRFVDVCYGRAVPKTFYESFFAQSIVDVIEGSEIEPPKIEKTPSTQREFNVRGHKKIPSTQFIIVQSPSSARKRYLKQKSQQFLKGVKKATDKADGVAYWTIGEASKLGTEVVGETTKVLAGILKGIGGIEKNAVGSNFLNSFSELAKDAGNYINNQSEKVRKSTVDGVKRVGETVNNVARETGKFVVESIDLFHPLNDIQKRKIGRFSTIAAKLVIPIPATAAAYFLFFSDIDPDDLMALAEEDPQLFEALARSTNDLPSSNPKAIEEYLSRFTNEKQIMGITNNVKGILGEMEMVELLNENKDGIMYQMYEATNQESFDIYGTINGEVVEQVQVKITESPSYVRGALEDLPFDTKVYVNSEIYDAFSYDPRVINSGILESELERRVGALFGGYG